MIRELSLSNFRAFEEAHIELSRINLLFGPNNSGKSALISAVNVIAQTLEGGDYSVPLHLDGTRVDLGTYRDVVFRNDSNRPVEIGMLLDMGNRRTGNDTIDFNAGFHYMRVRKAIIVNSFEMRGSIEDMEFSAKASEGYPDCWIGGYIKGSGTKRQPFRIRATYRNFVPVPFPRKKDLKVKRKGYYELSPEFSVVHYAFQHIREAFQNLEYLGPFRVYPSRTFHFTGAIPSTVGTRGENAIRILADDYLKLGKRKGQIAEKVSNWMTRSGVAEQIRVVTISSRHFEVILKHSLTGEEENLADIGFGCGQVLPILVSGYAAEKGSIFMVEQPELHLHPRAQAELGSFFYDMYKNGIQSIIETHSEHLLLRLQYYVAKGLVKPSDVRIYYVYADGRSKKPRKRIKEIRIDETGRFIDKWPEGFFPETLEEARRVAKARSDRR